MSGYNPKIITEHAKSRRPLAERVRRGTCLLNAAQYDEAIAELSVAADLARDTDPLRSHLESCFDHRDVTCRGDRAIDALRQNIAKDPENAELHFRLGAALVDGGHIEEAELRFTQALSISRDHVDALVSLALCHQRRFEARYAISYMRRAQALRPGDAKIAFLLAQAAKMAHQQGEPLDLCAVVANDESARG